ncbi:hypothetical protein Mhun_0361 [Methanospirillum hungatei JF-1]|uniref:Uncharacterized protein n=2 Tax=Methanospirillum hungatei TaxID=2203 RepID=Q2FMJ0_METHJ|nr:hypothetical protein Mhun_0361 [Methanospirillum hungatei JF-1]
MIGFVWSLLTYFVKSVMILRDLGIGASIKESAALFRRTCEAIVGPGSISLIFVIIGIIALAPVFLVSLSGNGALILAAITEYILLIVILTIIASALQEVLNTPLHIYAKTGTVPSAFSSDLITIVFVPKNSRMSPGNNYPFFIELT